MSTTAGTAAAGSSYWCYRCTRFIRVWAENGVVCPYCDSGFVEAVDSTPSPDSPRPFPITMVGNHRLDSDRSSNLRFRRRTRNSNGDRSMFNPVIVLRGLADGDGGAGSGGERNFEFYYDDGAGSGLRPLPPSMSEFLLGSGFDRLLDQLAQVEMNGFGRSEQPPASKAAVEAMPTIEIVAKHINSECHCAVCKEAFVLGSKAREMPCKHIYHSDCILPWLSLRNSCPVCRHELPIESTNESDNPNRSGNEEEMVGLTIWRLPGGGFAVGRFSGARRGAERELPVVYTEMDGGFNNNAAIRSITWNTRRSRAGTMYNGFGRLFRNLFSFARLGRLRSNSNQSSGSDASSSLPRSRSQPGMVFSRYLRRRSRAWVLDDQNAGGGGRGWVE